MGSDLLVVKTGSVCICLNTWQTRQAIAIAAEAKLILFFAWAQSLHQEFICLTSCGRKVTTFPIITIFPPP